jgi:hexulose-6-phosphate isomerase
MSLEHSRRVFLGSLGVAAAAAARLKVRKGVYVGMLPKNLSYADRFQLARDAGFDDVECATITDPRVAQEIQQAAATSGLRIHSVMNQAHWKFPLSSSDPAVVAESLQGMETSLENAHLWGADAVLLVPAVVNAQTRYQDAWTRSQQHIRKLLPLAEKLQVVIALENVWNKFLLSPLEMARYVDEFRSPWVRAYFDVGNVVLFGFPQDWIRTLGRRIIKVHLKDFRFQKMLAEFVPLREGAIEWPQVHQALGEIGYSGTATVELPGGDQAYLQEVSRRVDLILEGN